MEKIPQGEPLVVQEYLDKVASYLLMKLNTLSF